MAPNDGPASPASVAASTRQIRSSTIVWPARGRARDEQGAAGGESGGTSGDTGSGNRNALAEGCATAAPRHRPHRLAGTSASLRGIFRPDPYRPDDPACPCLRRLPARPAARARRPAQAARGRRDAAPRAEITTPEALSEESVVELSLRPQRLAEFIGQEKVKGNLRIAIAAAIARKEPLDHTLFHGPPGLGKTTLAELIARELGVNIHTTSGPAIEKPGDLVGRLTNMRHGDVLFIDEIHRLRPVIEEFLYPAMEDYKIDIRLSEGPKAQTMTIPIEKFTLVGATTRYGMLTSPMRARFGVVERLNYYPRTRSS
jgi:hypothetical protein